ncbi:PREDICTED: ES1 protein homolog, mitochondrial-like [Ceratosolen solmsi marchali]|uniref:ES1 protein homolog, mitochondrial-like n=1 Tax=Ceratosolen solmsi marchali TaxID=326594 RepID=A0AAJ6YKI3_9HYME|nr:PREDICTED: ES1 protein homolog, mitochondrial-like [Ceratosolen solmsi marchali]
MGIRRRSGVLGFLGAQLDFDECGLVQRGAWDAELPDEATANGVKKEKVEQEEEAVEEEEGTKRSAGLNVLTGCGMMDGTEISEAISTAIHLYKHNIRPDFYAPNIDVCASINHYTGCLESSDIPRNALVEAARIARSCIRPICKCKVCEYALLIIPGGAGVIRTLSDFSSAGNDCIVHPELRNIITEFRTQCKPIGTMCMASVLIAKVLPGSTVTLGKTSPKEQWPYASAIEKVKKMGAKVTMQNVHGVTYCKKHNLYSTPAWLDAHANYSDVHEGIGKMIAMIKKNMK